MTRNLFGGIPAEAITHGFSQRRPIRSVQIPLSLEKVPQISQIYTDFFSSDDTEFIRRFPAEAITHGFSQRRPIRSVQIPTEVGKSPTDFTDIHRFFLGTFFLSRRFRR